MGGLGLGRPSGFGRRAVETCRSIDVNRLHREGCLRPGRRGSWDWTRGGEKIASIGMRAVAGYLHLADRLRIGDRDREDVAETGDIVGLPCAFGGTRPYFICLGVRDGVVCGRRQGKLHGPGRYFLCRHCYRLAHASKGESTCDGARRRADRLRQRLGGDPGMASPFPGRPKGKWCRTYGRLLEGVIGAELTHRPLIREQAFGEALDAFRLERLGRYEVHLDRKLERMLTMLLKLKELRRGRIDD